VPGEDHERAAIDEQRLGRSRSGRPSRKIAPTRLRSGADIRTGRRGNPTSERGEGGGNEEQRVIDAKHPVVPAGGTVAQAGFQEPGQGPLGAGNAGNIDERQDFVPDRDTWLDHAGMVPGGAGPHKGLVWRPPALPAPSPPLPIPGCAATLRPMPDREQFPRPSHLVLVVSDGTGVTAERVVQAAMTQFDPDSVTVERISDARDPERIRSALALAAERRATVLFSLVAPQHRKLLLQEARRLGVWTIDLLGPLLLRLSSALAASPRAEAGLFRQIDEEYFRRIDAMDFTIKHDDGSRVQEVGQADLVLVGVSRTCKTPLSVFLGYRGWHVANVPIVLGLEAPPEIFAVDPRKVVAVSARPEWLVGVRRERSRRMAPGVIISYAETSHIEEELRWFRSIVARGGWTVVDVTQKAIEETASEIIALQRH
jgi:[pyruvate, water dikinase]-phosphate phosphotransferase / [pyruvate, water dikinase] kinase